MNKINLILKNYTNMHVGSGMTSSKITINEYAKDYFNNAPVVPASGFKGALRHNFLQSGVTEGELDVLFGYSKDNGKSMDMAELIFTDVKTVFYPVRTYFMGCNDQFFYITTDELLKESEFNEANYTKEQYIDVFKRKTKFKKLSNGDFIENIKLEEDIEFYKDTKVMIVSEELFKTIMEKAPIITRNKVTNETDSPNNVWNEEIVPKNTIFYTSIFYQDSVKAKVVKDVLRKRLNKLNTTNVSEMLQIGANASIGMGYCRIFGSEAK